MMRYVKGSSLGQGAYGVVTEGMDLITKEGVALKMCPFPNGGIKGLPSLFLREAVLLKQLQHNKHVVALLDVIMEDTRIHLIFELTDGGDDQYLKAFMGRYPGEYLPSSLVKDLSKQMMTGLCFIHGKGIIHRDIKPQNILMKGNTLKIADFGLACNLNPFKKVVLSSRVVTLWYRPIELLLGSTQYECEVDVWSAACVMLELSNGKVFSPGDSEIGAIHKIFQNLGTPTIDDWPGIEILPFWRANYPDWQPKSFQALAPRLCPQGHQLIECMLKYDPKKRITANDIMSHVYIKSIAIPEAKTVKETTPLSYCTIEEDDYATTTGENDGDLDSDDEEIPNT